MPSTSSPTRKRKTTAKRRAVRKRPPTPQLRTSERSTFKRCRWQWDRNYNDRVRPLREAPALRFGTLIHKALEERYPPGIKRGPKPAQTFEKLYEADVKDAWDNWGFRADEDEEWHNAGELGVDMLEHFIEVYGRDEDWKVLGSEVTFKVPIYGMVVPEQDAIVPAMPGDRGAKLLFHYVGTMDGVWQSRMDEGIRIVDWKTTKNDPTRLQHLILDEQATAYWTWGVDHLIAKKIIKPRQVEALDGMLYTFMRKAKRDARPRNAQGHYLNKDGSISKSQPPPYFHRELVYREEASREVARARVIEEWMEMTNFKHLPEERRLTIKTPGSGPMSHCNFCPFRDACELHEAGADWRDLMEVTMVSWNPYAAHEIAEEGKVG